MTEKKGEVCPDCGQVHEQGHRVLGVVEVGWHEFEYFPTREALMALIQKGVDEAIAMGAAEPGTKVEELRVEGVTAKIRRPSDGKVTFLTAVLKTKDEVLDEFGPGDKSEVN